MLLSVWVLSLVLVACGEADDSHRPRRVPTRIPPTPTLRSTALPDVPEAPDVGAPERPIVIRIAVPDERKTSAIRQTAQQLAQLLTDELGLVFKIELTDEKSALDALCSGGPVMGWVSAFTYAAARQQCEAIPLLAVKRGRLPTFTIGQSSEIVGRVEIADLSQMAGRTFCRSEAQDMAVSWVLPALLLGASGVNPFVDLEAIRDYPDDPAVILALHAGECDAAAFRPGDFNRALQDAANVRTEPTGEQPGYSDLVAALHVIVPAADTTAPASTPPGTGFPAGILPYEVLVSAPESALPQELRESIVERLENFFNDRAEGTSRTKRLLDADGILRVESKDYRPFVTMLEKAGWHMAFFP